MLRGEDPKSRLQGHSLHDRDDVGNRVVFDTILEKQSGIYQHVERAYQIANKLGDKERLSTARRKMIELSPLGALREFNRRKDDEGIDLVLETVARDQEVDVDALKEAVRSYCAQE